MGAFPRRHWLIPAAVENSMGAFPRRHWLSLPLWCPRGGLPFWLPVAPAFSFVFAPYPPDPLPRRGRGRPKLFHARGFAPCIPSIRPPAALARPAVSAPSGAGAVSCRACFACRINAFLPPSPRPPSRREGGDQSYFMQGAPPLASPGMNPGGTGSRGGEARPAGYHSGRFCKCRRRFNAGVPGAEPPAK